MKKSYIIGGVAVLAVVASVPMLASAYGGHGGEGYRMHGGKHAKMDHRGGRHGKARMMELIETWDADKNGSVTQAEIDTFRADRLAKFDVDGNGELSLEEYEALWLDAMRERMVDAFQRHDDDGNGQVTAEEFGERFSRIVAMRDRNDDGVLSLDDLERKGQRRGHKPSE